MDLLKEKIEKISGRPINILRIDKDRFNKFMSTYEDNRPGVTIEKRLEYYISLLVLEPAKGDVYMDVAAQDCPFAFWVKKHTKAKIYRQDLYYIKEGISGEDIGGNVSNIPLPDGSVSRMSLHCSLEHLEDDYDILFIKEAQRLLRPGGRLCIVPLYIDEKYGIDTEAGYIDEKGQKQLWGIGARFARTYSPEKFKERILYNAPLLEPSIYYVENAADIDPGCYVRFVCLLTRKEAV